MKLSTRGVLIITILTLIVWIGYETYTSLNRATQRATVKQELLRELTEDENEEVIDNLSKRIAY